MERRRDVSSIAYNRTLDVPTYVGRYVYWYLYIRIRIRIPIIIRTYWVYIFRDASDNSFQIAYIAVLSRRWRDRWDDATTRLLKRSRYKLYICSSEELEPATLRQCGSALRHYRCEPRPRLHDWPFSSRRTFFIKSSSEGRCSGKNIFSGLVGVSTRMLLISSIAFCSCRCFLSASSVRHFPICELRARAKITPLLGLLRYLCNASGRSRRGATATNRTPPSPPPPPPPHHHQQPLLTEPRRDTRRPSGRDYYRPTYLSHRREYVQYAHISTLTAIFR